MNTTYTTENDRNGKARYYRVTDGKKKVISRAEYEAHTGDMNSESSVTEAVYVPEAEENAQIAFDETPASIAEVHEDFVETSPAEIATSDTDTAADNEPISTEAAFCIVKNIVNESGIAHFDKMYLQNSKKCSMVCYRNRIVCTFKFDSNGMISKIKFMGTTAETRKKASLFNIANSKSIYDYKNDILRQIEFIDLWYSNSVKTKAS